MSSAALPGAALRVMRTAAGWRALRLALLVGGLLVLGVLCGERAQAAEGAPSVRGAVDQVLDAVPLDLAQTARTAGAPPAAPDARPGRGAGPAVLDGLRPVTGHAVRTVTDQVVRPVGDVVAAVTEELGTAVRVEVPPLEALPQPAPSLPTDPSLPTPPSPPSAPTLPDLSTLPDRSGPPVRPAPGAREPGPATAPDTGLAESGTSDARPASGTRPVSGAPAISAGLAFGPGLDRDGEAGVAAHDDARGVPAGPHAHAPAHRAPTGDADGALGTGADADAGPPRHADAHAIAPHHRVPVRLVPGAVVHTEAPDTRERYRDIPVSPA
ncbi:hypothetical protein ACWDTR_06375 [Streptomyces sp. NPDC003470]